jgi:MFS family permease
MCAPAAPSILTEFHSSNQLYSTILVSIWELGEVVGPLVIGPLSEIYGRLPVYHTANILFITFAAIAAISQSINMLIAFRFLLPRIISSIYDLECVYRG